MKCAAQVSLSAFAFLFSELVQYCQTKVSNIGELERRCEVSPCGAAHTGARPGMHRLSSCAMQA